MDFPHIPKQDRITNIVSGNILIAEPFLSDGTFSRTVVLLCEHADNGTIGFVLNKQMPLSLTDLMPDLDIPMLLCEGGPVQPDTLHMLHRMPETLGGLEVADGIYWGGSFDVLQDILKSGLSHLPDVRLLVGYSGWSAGQLDNELNEGSWYVSKATAQLVFDTDISNIWRSAVISLGPEYKHLLNLPPNPQLN